MIIQTSPEARFALVTFLEQVHRSRQPHSKPVDPRDLLDAAIILQQEDTERVSFGLGQIVASYTNAQVEAAKVRLGLVEPKQQGSIGERIKALRYILEYTSRWFAEPFNSTDTQSVYSRVEELVNHVGERENFGDGRNITAEDISVIITGDKDSLRHMRQPRSIPIRFVLAAQLLEKIASVRPNNHQIIGELATYLEPSHDIAAMGNAIRDVVGIVDVKSEVA